MVLKLTEHVFDLHDLLKAALTLQFSFVFGKWMETKDGLYTPMAYIPEVVFVETPILYRRVQQLMDDDDCAELQLVLAARPDAGKIIKGSGGMRKLRWAGSGRGKRAGLRVIYYWWVAKNRISMLLVYPKNEMDDLSADQVNN